MNRYFSMSRRSSLFFGSHKGTERARCALYVSALSAKMNHLNIFEYLTDILDKIAHRQPNAPLENYRNLLPDLQPSTKTNKTGKASSLADQFSWQYVNNTRYAFT